EEMSQPRGREVDLAGQRAQGMRRGEVVGDQVQNPLHARVERSASLWRVLAYGEQEYLLQAIQGQLVLEGAWRLHGRSVRRAAVPGEARRGRAVKCIRGASIGVQPQESPVDALAYLRRPEARHEEAASDLR